MAKVKTVNTVYRKFKKNHFDRLMFFAIAAFLMVISVVYAKSTNEYETLANENEEYIEQMAYYEDEMQEWHNNVDHPHLVVYSRNEKEVEAYEKVCAIGTSSEKSVFGYDVSYVLKVITGEGGNTEEDINGVTQCIYNAIQRYKNVEGVTYTPEQIVKKDKYCNPASYISYAAKKAFVYIFIEDGKYESYGNSVIFYNPKVLGHTNVTHEKFTFEYESASGVRFFSK